MKKLIMAWLVIFPITCLAQVQILASDCTIYVDSTAKEKKESLRLIVSIDDEIEEFGIAYKKGSVIRRFRIIEKNGKRVIYEQGIRIEDYGSKFLFRTTLDNVDCKDVWLYYTEKGKSKIKYKRL